MQERDERSPGGGDTPEETPYPVRVNPYLRKNRVPPKKKAPPMTPPEDTGFGYAPRRRLSDWIFENVRWIAALITALCITSFFFIFDVEEMVEAGTNLFYSIARGESSEMSLTYVHGLCDRAAGVSWEDLENFRRTENTTSTSVTWMIPVAKSDYEIWISGSSTAQRPTYVRLYHMDSGDMLDLLKVRSSLELEEFLRSQLD